MRDHILKLQKLLEQEHSKAQTLKIVNYVGGHQKHFDALFKIFTSGSARLIQRSSWAINYCVQEKPQLLEKHFATVIKLLIPESPVAVKRNCTRMLQFVKIPEKWMGHLFERCYQLVYSAKEPIAVRCFGMQVLSNIAEEIPDLKAEVRELLLDLKDHESAGIRSRVRRLLKNLN